MHPKNLIAVLFFSLIFTVSAFGAVAVEVGGDLSTGNNIFVRDPVGDLQIGNTTWSDMNLYRDSLNTQTQSWFRIYTNGGAVEQLRITDDDEASIVGDGTFTSNGLDYAEAFRISDQTIQPGDVVVLDLRQPGFIQRSKRSYASNLAGVVSERPGFVTGQSFLAEEQADADIARQRRDARARGNVEMEKNYTMQLQEKARGQYRPVALAGRVPVKVDGAHGPILPGDRLTSSPTPGYAMAMKSPGQSIGIALEAWDSAEQGKILVLIQPGWCDPRQVGEIDR